MKVLRLGLVFRLGLLVRYAIHINKPDVNIFTLRYYEFMILCGRVKFVPIKTNPF